MNNETTNTQSLQGMDAVQLMAAQSQDQGGQSQNQKKEDADKRSKDEALDEALAETFPTSDPPSPYVPPREN